MRSKKLFNIYVWKVEGWVFISRLHAYSSKQARFIYHQKSSLYFNDISARTYPN